MMTTGNPDDGGRDPGERILFAGQSKWKSARTDQVRRGLYYTVEEWSIGLPLYLRVSLCYPVPFVCQLFILFCRLSGSPQVHVMRN